MKKVKLLASVLLFIIGLKQAIACDCKNLCPLENLRNVSYENADLVFLGELIQSDFHQNTYTFRIIEGFKGEFESTTISGGYFNSCSVFPEDRGQWIVYAQMQDDGMINLSQCSASRSKANPSRVMCYKTPTPPSPSNRPTSPSPSSTTNTPKRSNPSAQSIPPIPTKTSNHPEIDPEISALKKQAGQDWLDELVWLRQK